MNGVNPGHAICGQHLERRDGYFLAVDADQAQRQGPGLSNLRDYRNGSQVMGINDAHLTQHDVFGPDDRDLACQI